MPPEVKLHMFINYTVKIGDGAESTDSNFVCYSYYNVSVPENFQDNSEIFGEDMTLLKFDITSNI